MTMSLPVLSGQLLVGLINGSFYAILSLGLSIIFGLLGIVNLTQGAFYMVGAFFAWMLLQAFGIGYWGALILAPLGVAAVGVILELVLIRRIYQLDHSYGLLLTFGLLAAPIYAVSPLMGADIIIVVFAVVVIGGMGSILGSIVSGVSLGLLEGLTKAVYPQASSTVIFAMMILVLLIRPAGLFGWEK